MAGFAGSSTLNNVPAVTADVCPFQSYMLLKKLTICDIKFATSRELGRFISIYSINAFGGPALGPLIGEFITNHAYWRWNLRVQAIFVGVTWIGLICFVPESHHPTLLRQRAKRMIKEQKKNQNEDFEIILPAGPTLLTRLKLACYKPLVYLFTEPIVAAVCLYLSLLYGIVSILFL